MAKYGKKEEKYVVKALRSNNLFYVKGKFSQKLVSRVKEYFSVKYAGLCSSGSAAIHCALGALDIPPGYEVITSPITDIGTVIGILYQNLIPIFADVDPHTYVITPESILKKISDRTKAIIVVHLAGNPAMMDKIMEIAEERGIYVIEDCAQAYGAKYMGKAVGTWGHLGCYSLNEFKHISAGDGGFFITNDEDLYIRAKNFADKYYDRETLGIRLKRLAPNYRITELQSAVALAQFEKLDDIASRKHELGEYFNAKLKELNLPLEIHERYSGAYCSYWFTMFRIRQSSPISRENLIKRIKSRNIGISPGYIDKPLYKEPMFVNKSFFPGGIWPAEVVSGKTYSYTGVKCENAENVLKTAIRINFKEGCEKSDIDRLIGKIRDAFPS